MNRGTKEWQARLCGRLQRLGYAPSRRVRLYGEEFELVSEPTPDGACYAIQAISRTSGTLRQLRIPLSVTQVIEKELIVMDQIKRAA